MSRCLVLHAEALVALAGRNGRRFLEIRAALRAAARLNREVVVPSVILAELYRGPRHNAQVDACLSRETGIRVRDTDRPLARIVDGVLAAAQADLGTPRRRTRDRRCCAPERHGPRCGGSFTIRA